MRDFQLFFLIVSTIFFIPRSFLLVLLLFSLFFRITFALSPCLLFLRPLFCMFVSHSLSSRFGLVKRYSLDLYIDFQKRILLMPLSHFHCDPYACRKQPFWPFSYEPHRMKIAKTAVFYTPYGLRSQYVTAALVRFYSYH